MCNEQHKRCQHGMCLNHKPDWENIGEPENKVSPGILGIMVYLFSRCCGRRMMRMLSVQKKRCKKCGREKYFSEDVFALCSCCGQKISKVSYSS